MNSKKPRDQREIEASEAMAPLALAHARGIVQRIERGQMANPVTLKTFFEGDGALTEIGGTPYLAQLGSPNESAYLVRYGRTKQELRCEKRYWAMERPHAAVTEFLDGPAIITR